MRIIVRDRNLNFINSFNEYSYSKTITLQHGDIFLDEDFDALVSPANSFGFMNGGIDGVYIQKYGQQLEDRVRSYIKSMLFDGEMLVGQAIAIPVFPLTLTNGSCNPEKYLIVAPTMRVPKPITDYVDVYLATRAAIRLAVICKFDTVVIPGMGTATGNVPYGIAARNMLVGIHDALEGPREYTTCAEAYLDNDKFNF